MKVLLFLVLVPVFLCSACLNQDSWEPKGEASILSFWEDPEASPPLGFITVKIENTGQVYISGITLLLSCTSSIREYYFSEQISCSIPPEKSFIITFNVQFFIPGEQAAPEGVQILDCYFE